MAPFSGKNDRRAVLRCSLFSARRIVTKRAARPVERFFCCGPLYLWPVAVIFIPRASFHGTGAVRPRGWRKVISA